MALYDKFVGLRDKHSSIIVLGQDPKPDQYGLVDRISQDFLLPIIGTKPNEAFYVPNNSDLLLTLLSRTQAQGKIGILDAKLSDGGATNSAKVAQYKGKVDAITIAPAAGCIEHTIRICKEAGIETISMGVMSFPGVLREIVHGYGLFIDRAERAIDAGTSGFVMGATAYVPENKFSEAIEEYRNNKDDPISTSEMNNSELEKAIYCRNNLFKRIISSVSDRGRSRDILFLVPGFGRQGGRIDNFIASGIDINNCMINAGSDIIKAEDPYKAVEEMRITFENIRNN